mmetsp:Transcript_14961/g.34085  ORF Transcript_14961/g.34085 Transcript_14961/m.34085 type:complete len:640 (-) Transcript_14961:185-2104(-)
MSDCAAAVRQEADWPYAGIEWTYRYTPWRPSLADSRRPGSAPPVGRNVGRQCGSRPSTSPRQQHRSPAFQGVLDGAEACYPNTFEPDMPAPMSPSALAQHFDDAARVCRERANGPVTVAMRKVLLKRCPRTVARAEKLLEAPPKEDQRQKAPRERSKQQQKEVQARPMPPPQQPGWKVVIGRDKKGRPGTDQALLQPSEKLERIPIRPPRQVAARPSALKIETQELELAQTAPFAATPSRKRTSSSLRDRERMSARLSLLSTGSSPGVPSPATTPQATAATGSDHDSEDGRRGSKHQKEKRSQRESMMNRRVSTPASQPSPKRNTVVGEHGSPQVPTPFATPRTSGLAVSSDQGSDADSSRSPHSAGKGRMMPRSIAQRCSKVKRMDKEATIGNRTTAVPRASPRRNSTGVAESAATGVEEHIDIPVDVLVQAQESKLPLHDVRVLHDAFMAADTGGVGSLDSEGFTEVTLKVLKERFDNVDPENVVNGCKRYWEGTTHGPMGRLNFQEMFKFYAVHCFSEDWSLTADQRRFRELAKELGVSAQLMERVKLDFDKQDSDGSGFIDMSEFKDILYKILRVPGGVELPDSRVHYFWKEVDRDGSGSINFDEFVRWWMLRSEQIMPYEDFYRRIRPPWGYWK